MDQFVPAVAMLSLVKKVIDFFKYLSNQDWNGAVTQLVVWGAGVLVICLYAQTDWAEGIPIGTTPLADLNGWSQIAVGLGVGSIASVTTDFIKSRDDSDSAAMPPLIK